MDASITIDDKVIAFGFVPAVDVDNCVVFAFRGGRTMDDDFGNLSHKRIFDLRLNTNFTNITNRAPARK